ncbi:Fic family protein [Leptolyngbya cf. ectocarpi LEGE 11479]|uniref:Fic family protein n=1 Tax=Leptolyngbya cf. ectocarpi LEGE 11479 TaxID=1828722 RepID=A0A929FBM2_LEPEC|nr:Fic family protein [Leptolyngbya ectocarpi]MBE9068798.1 Fic family protein [Leptolyngbya cf. ectocarpi LEGE 11479]
MSICNTSCPYDQFIAALKARKIWDVGTLIQQMLGDFDGMSLTEKYAQVDKLKGWLDSFRPLPSTVVAELKQLFDVRFTYNSNAIEGNTLTQSETQLVLEKGITVGGKTLIEHLEVVGHRDAIDYVESLAQQETKIGEWEIRQIHSLLFMVIDRAEAGRYRQLDVKAAGTEYTYPPHYLLPELMAEFVEWLNSDVAQQMHPIDYAAEAHCRFVGIHPFRDGNGRTGRLLMNLLLLRFGYPVVVISNERRKAYIEALVEAQQRESLGLFQELMLEAVRESLVEVLRVAVTTAESQNKSNNFYGEILAFLNDFQA